MVEKFHRCDFFSREVVMKADVTGSSGQVLRPLMARYGLQLDQLVVILAGTTQVLPNQAPIKDVDGKTLRVLSCDEFRAWVQGEIDHLHSPERKDSPVPSPKLSRNDPLRSPRSGMLKFVRKPRSPERSMSINAAAAVLERLQKDKGTAPINTRVSPFI
jgi:hypothetical protein